MSIQRQNLIKEKKNRKLKRQQTVEMRGILDGDILCNKRRMAKEELDKIMGPETVKLHVPEDVPHLTVVNSQPSLMDVDIAQEFKEKESAVSPSDNLKDIEI